MDPFQVRRFTELCPEFSAVIHDQFPHCFDDALFSSDSSLTTDFELLDDVTPPAFQPPLEPLFQLRPSASPPTPSSSSCCCGSSPSCSAKEEQCSFAHPGIASGFQAPLPCGCRNCCSCLCVGQTPSASPNTSLACTCNSRSQITPCSTQLQPRAVPEQTCLCYCSFNSDIAPPKTMTTDFELCTCGGDAGAAQGITGCHDIAIQTKELRQDLNIDTVGGNRRSSIGDICKHETSRDKSRSRSRNRSRSRSGSRSRSRSRSRSESSSGQQDSELKECAILPAFLQIFSKHMQTATTQLKAVTETAVQAEIAKLIPSVQCHSDRNCTPISTRSHSSSRSASHKTSNSVRSHNISGSAQYATPSLPSSSSSSSNTPPSFLQFEESPTGSSWSASTCPNSEPTRQSTQTLTLAGLDREKCSIANSTCNFLELGQDDSFSLDSECSCSTRRLSPSGRKEQSDTPTSADSSASHCFQNPSVESDAQQDSGVGGNKHLGSKDCVLLAIPGSKPAIPSPQSQLAMLNKLPSPASSAASRNSSNKASPSSELKFLTDFEPQGLQELVKVKVASQPFLHQTNYQERTADQVDGELDSSEDSSDESSPTWQGYFSSLSENGSWVGSSDSDSSSGLADTTTQSFGHQLQVLATANLRLGDRARNHLDLSGFGNGNSMFKFQEGVARAARETIKRASGEPPNLQQVLSRCASVSQAGEVSLNLSNFPRSD